MGGEALTGGKRKSRDAKGEVRYQELFRELEETVRELEREDVPLERALSLFRRGVEVSRLLAVHLEETEQEVFRLVEEAGGGFGLAPVKAEGLGPAGDDPNSGG